MDEKVQELESVLREQKKVAIAFSGGIDSVYLTSKAVEVLGKENVLAVLVNSELFTDEEFNNAEKTAEVLGFNYKTAYMHELNNKAIANNEPSTWYNSKKELYSTIKHVALLNGFSTVLDGMIMDDLSDFRPGMKARDEANVSSPLQDTNFYKKDIRKFAKQDGINVWNKVASCSLCSRFPYNTHITKKMINQVIEGERYLRSIGFNPVRVRHHGTVARIEVLPEMISDIVNDHEVITKEFKKLGFLYVSLDLEGYSLGKMNETLTKEEIKRSYTD